MLRSPGVDALRFDLGRIPSGEAGTDETLRRIGDLVEDSIQRQAVRLAALRILERAGVANKDGAGAARAIFNWIRTHVRYVPDPASLETIQAPEITLRLRAGDCDDHAALANALLHSIGIPSRFVVIGPSPDRFVHVYAEAFVRDAWRSMDTTRATRFGAAVPKLGSAKRYSWKGRPLPMAYISLGANESTATRGIAIDVDKLRPFAYRGALKAMKNNWNAGLINRADVVGYLQVIDSGNSPGRGTFAEKPMRQAVVDFLAEIDRKGMRSTKSSASSTGLEGLDGFLKSVWNGVKKAVGGAVKLLGGGGSQITVNPPAINIPAVTTQVTPETGRAVLSDILKSPVTWIIAGGVVLALFFGLRGGRR